jgi:hypothetical protein
MDWARQRINTHSASGERLVDEFFILIEWNRTLHSPERIID